MGQPRARGARWAGREARRRPGRAPRPPARWVAHLTPSLRIVKQNAQLKKKWEKSNVSMNFLREKPTAQSSAAFAAPRRLSPAQRPRRAEKHLWRQRKMALMEAFCANKLRCDDEGARWSHAGARAEASSAARRGGDPPRLARPRRLGASRRQRVSL